MAVQIVLYFVCLIVIGILLTLIEGYFELCDPFADMIKLIHLLRKRSWEDEMNQ